MTQLSNRQAIVLAALASDPDASFSPVQIQKLFFLIDENAAHLVGEKLFSFEPYDYGPFDQSVYRELEQLQSMGLVFIGNAGSYGGSRRYYVSPEGAHQGLSALSSLNPSLKKYITEVGAWVRSLSFAELVGAIYKAYPRMRENSIFEG